MKLQLVSLTGIKYDDEAYEVVIPTAEGAIAVYDGHMPLVSLAVPGLLSVRKQKSDSDSARQEFASAGGVVEIDSTTVRILVDEAEKAEDIVAAEAQAAFERAQKMKAEATSQVEIERAQALMDRHAARLHIADLRRRHHPKV
ncbi:MAG TPA: ATP synthase F1 subunit epsilon [Candidatus Saccharimonadales bacterium]|nr:ATP synthase F1 subunit epsilon [Candidatus Saccharimonadales bacterium]